MHISISKMLQNNATSQLYTPNSLFSTLGIVGPPEDHSAMERWTLTAHLSTSVSCNLKDLCGINSNSDEKKLSSKTIEESKKAVQLLVLTITQLKTLLPLMVVQTGIYITLPLDQLLQRR